MYPQALKKDHLTPQLPMILEIELVIKYKKLYGCKIKLSVFFIFKKLRGQFL